MVGTVGIGWCFVVKAAIFGFVIASLLALDTRRLHPVPPERRGHGQLRAGLRYAVGVSAIIRPLLMMALVGTFTFEFEVSRPVVQHGRSTPHPGRARLRDRRRPPRGGSHAGHRDRRVRLDRRGQRHVLTTGNSTIQLASSPEYRGHVTALWSMALVGSTPIGSPVIGTLSDLAGPRYAVALSAWPRGRGRGR